MFPAVHELIRVVVTDDSDLATEQIRRILAGATGVQLVGIAHSLRELDTLCERERPDVVTLDLLMPAGNGLSAIRRLSERTQVVVVSDHPSASPLAREAIAQGASAFVEKRTLARPDGRAKLVQALLRAVRPAPATRVAAIAGSTGAMPALEAIIPELSGSRVPLVVVQHLPAERMQTFADWLTTLGVPARVARAGMKLTPGEALVAPGDRHLRIGKSHDAQLGDDSPVGGHKPSATVLFESLVPLASKAVVAVLSGMGSDGAGAIPALLAGGAAVLVQRPDTCPVASMPEQASSAAAGRARSYAPGELGIALRWCAEGRLSA